MTTVPMSTIKDRLADERVLLVGGAGFIGHNLALGLREIGIDTAIVDNLMINSLIENVYDSDSVPEQRQLYRNFIGPVRTPPDDRNGSIQR